MSNNTEEKNTCSPSLTFFVNGKKVCFNFLFIWIKINNSNLHWTSVCDFIALSCNTLKFVIISPHKRSLGQGNVFTPVCLSRRGRCYDVTSCYRQHHPPGQHHPWIVPLPDRTSLQTAPSQTAPPPGQHHPHLDSTTPSRSTSGRYASYCNAFLFLIV